MEGLVDTTVIIHLYRKQAGAWAWVRSRADAVGITPFVWLEVMYGTPNKASQITCEALMEQFELVFPVQSDMDWAMRQMKTYRLSHGTTVLDALIASVAYRLKLPLFTHNLKDMRPLLGSLAVQPY